MRCAMILLFSLAAALAWAQDRVGTLPGGASQLQLRGETYYYAGGFFYRAENGGYRRVEPPLGARVPDVPGDSDSFTMGGDRYFVTPDETVFLYDPSGNDYAVVTPPYGWRDRYRASPERYSLPAPQRPETPRAYPPRPYPEYRAEGYYGRYPGGSYQGLYRGESFYGRYRFRDDAYEESYRERRSACRRIATDQSRRGKVGPYRRQPGSYWDEYERCLR